MMNRRWKLLAIILAVAVLCLIAGSIYRVWEFRTRPSPSVAWIENKITLFGKLKLPDWIQRHIPVSLTFSYTLKAANSSGTRVWTVSQNLVGKSENELFQAPPWAVVYKDKIAISKIDYTSFLSDKPRIEQYLIDLKTGELTSPPYIAWNSSSTEALSISPQELYWTALLFEGNVFEYQTLCDDYMAFGKPVFFNNRTWEIMSKPLSSYDRVENKYWHVNPDLSAGEKGLYVTVSYAQGAGSRNTPSGKPVLRLGFFDLHLDNLVSLYDVAVTEENGFYRPLLVEPDSISKKDYIKFGNARVSAKCLVPVTNSGKSLLYMGIRARDKNSASRSGNYFVEVNSHNGISNLYRFGSDESSIELAEMDIKVTYSVYDYRNDQTYFLVSPRSQSEHYVYKYNTERGISRVIALGETVDERFVLAPDGSIWYVAKIDSRDDSPFWCKLCRFDPNTGKVSTIVDSVDVIFLYGSHLGPQ